MKTLIYSIILNKSDLNELKKKYFSYLIKKKNKNISFQIKKKFICITHYKSGKTVFQGKKANKFINYYKKKKKILASSGSDETGTGDYFGPIVVCTCYINKKNYNKLTKFNIIDSKKISINSIFKIGKYLYKNLINSVIILNNLYYNKISKKHNLNYIKTILHNKNFINLNKKINLKKTNNIIDQFTSKKSYFNFLKKKQKIFKNLKFKIKSEKKYFSVACASIIARFIFLKKMNKISKKYNNFKFPKGSNKKVDNAAIKFINKYGIKELKKVSKLNFSNTKRILKKI